MLKPQDVFRDFTTFCDWWCDVVHNAEVGLEALRLWLNETPCVPGSYGISIKL